MSHDTDKLCPCTPDHRPPYLETEEHHILPIYLGGPKDGELVNLCPTTHTNVHEIIRLFLKYGKISYRVVQKMQDRPVSKYAYNVALMGYIRYLAAT